MDTKVLGSIERGGGRHPGVRKRGRHGVGWQHLHVAIDLASRIVFAQLRPSAGKRDTTRVPRRCARLLRCEGDPGASSAHRQRTGVQAHVSEAAAARPAAPHAHQALSPLDDGRVERFIGTISRECLYARELHSDEERALVIALYLAYYNAERPHTRFGGLSPFDWLARR